MTKHGSREWWHIVGVLLVVAVGYAIIVTIVTKVVDKETGGTVGTTLALLFSGVLSRFEWRAARGRRDEESAPQLALTVSGFWYFLTLTLATIGLQFFLGVLGGVALYWYVHLQGNVQNGLLVLFRLHDNTAFLVGLFILNCFAYFAGGFLCGKTASNIRYGHAAFSSLVVYAINAAPIVMLYGWYRAVSLVAPFGLFALMYVLMALAGTRLGSKRPISQSVFGQEEQATSG